MDRPEDTLASGAEMPPLPRRRGSGAAAMPRGRPALRCACAAVLLGLATGCALSGGPGGLPGAARVLAVPADLPNPRLFDCAAAGVARRAEAGGPWPPVTLRDDAAGLLESGHFAERNRSGLRVRIERPPGAAQARVSLRASGAYHADLGAEPALADFTAWLQACTGGAVR
ncbi:hypothetical protein M4R22_11750 [Acidovorax sp. GBBC 3334]|uniref:hypothetical protein n=1 Tax=Acidovorax sp. GBBC 3334 TaxID=2940496 RepID=UPI0023035B8E|nr:hypothetical protein [Acidovorax sp. GBBC 3334]MDA8455436.1 hypothetical protein [Acidovorax sp. GBBC 3334]